MIKYLMSLILLFLIFENTAFSDETLVNYHVNWREKQLEIIINTKLETTGKPLPSVKFNAEKSIHQKLPYILFEGIEELTIDSRTKGKDFILQYPAVIETIMENSKFLFKEYSLLASDMKSLSTKYTINLYPDIVKMFITHSRVSSVSPVIEFVPSADFSGIIIYVDKQLPLYGKQSQGSFVPSLFPRIFDEELNLIADPQMIYPEMILERGSVSYQYLSDPPDLSRIGMSPLNLNARGIFGVNNTDLIISSREAEKILSRQSNIDLIHQGKILIIYNRPDQIKPDHVD